MLMCPNHLQNWLDSGGVSLIFFILVAFWLSETGWNCGVQANRKLWITQYLITYDNFYHKYHHTLNNSEWSPRPHTPWSLINGIFCGWMKCCYSRLLVSMLASDYAVNQHNHLYRNHALSCMVFFILFCWLYRQPRNRIHLIIMIIYTYVYIS